MFASFVQWITGPAPNQGGYGTWYNATSLGIPVDFYSDDTRTLTDNLSPMNTGFIFGSTYDASNNLVADNFFAFGGQLELTANSLPYPSRGSINDSFYTYLSSGAPDVNSIPAYVNFDNQTIPRDRGELVEVACLPTSLIAVELPPRLGLSTQICSYISKRRSINSAQWESNYGGYAVSTAAAYWSKPTRTKWRNNASFTDPWQMAALTRKNYTDRYLYVFGTPNGRYGGAKISRVEQRRVLDISAYPSPYTYWDGESWVKDKSRAIDVIPAPVGELSVFYHNYSGQWLAGYRSENQGGIVVRTAANPWGPWSEENLVVSDDPFVGCFGCFFHPKSRNLENPYFTMSASSPYNVRLWKLTL